MCVNHVVMVPAVVNLVATKGRDTYSGFISDFACFKCMTFSTNDKEIEVSSDIWRHGKGGGGGGDKLAPPRSVRSRSPHSAFKRWRKSAGLRLSDSKQNGQGLAITDLDTKEDMSLLKFLAINALDLSAPASDVLLKSRGQGQGGPQGPGCAGGGAGGWFQLSGHPDSLAPAGPGTVWKRRARGTDDTERAVYERLARDAQLDGVVPRYHREVEYQGERFIELQDLLQGFQDPYVMDIKMGTRTFLESEVQKTTARTDLYQKMMAMDADAPTAKEHLQQAVTKLRYMQFREQQSSTCSHGFRIEAMKCRGSPPVTDLKKVKSGEEVGGTLERFLAGRRDVQQLLGRRLNDIRTRIERSEFFRTHEVVGCSVFVVFDDHRVGAWLIDFAKTSALPDGVTVSHRDAWVPGNHEEGLLFGLDTLISVVEGLEIQDSPKGTFSKSMTAVSVKS